MARRRLRDNAYRYPMKNGFTLVVSRVFKGLDSIEKSVEWQYHVVLGINSIAHVKGFPTKRLAKEAGMKQ